MSCQLHEIDPDSSHLKWTPLIPPQQKKTGPSIPNPMTEQTSPGRYQQQQPHPSTEAYTTSRILPLTHHPDQNIPAFHHHQRRCLENAKRSTRPLQRIPTISAASTSPGHGVDTRQRQLDPRASSKDRDAVSSTQHAARSSYDGGHGGATLYRGASTFRMFPPGKGSLEGKNRGFSCWLRRGHGVCMWTGTVCLSSTRRAAGKSVMQYVLYSLFGRVAIGSDQIGLICWKESTYLSRYLARWMDGYRNLILAIGLDYLTQINTRGAWRKSAEKFLECFALADISITVRAPYNLTDSRVSAKSRI